MAYEWIPIPQSEYGFIAYKPHDFFCLTDSGMQVVHHTGNSLRNTVYDYYTDSDMRLLAQEVGLHVTPSWWQAWHSTQAWLAGSQVRLVDAYFEADSRQEADSVFEDNMRIAP